MIETGILPSSDGTKLFYRTFPLDQSRQPVVITHGFAEHSGRYAEVMQAIKDAGFAPIAFDLRGHGKSEGKRGCIRHFDDYIADLNTMVEFARTRHKSDRVISLGHSMGGLIAANHAKRYPQLVRGLALSSPLFGIRVPVPAWKEKLGRAMSLLWPSFSMPNEIDPSYLTHDVQRAEKYQSDPLIFRHVCARWFSEILSVTATFSAEKKLEQPLLLQLAEDDHIVSFDKSRSWFEGLEKSDKTLQIYKGFYHEIYNELERSSPISDLTSWLKAQA